MRQIPAKIKPKAGFSHFIHIALMCLLPLLLLVLVRLKFSQLPIGIALILLSKWRMFAVKPRHWPANIRANAVDIIVGLSVLIFMINSANGALQLLWAAAYAAWLLFVKPQSSSIGVSAQALIAQTVGLVALFIELGGASLYVLVIGTWTICYMAARHFFASFDESLNRYLSATWSYFSSALVWVLGHWLIFYGPVAQPALLLSVIGFGLGGIYYLEKSDRSSVVLRRQIIFVVFAVTTIVLTFSEWGDKAIQ